MIVRGESTIIDYHAPFDQGLMYFENHLNLQFEKSPEVSSIVWRHDKKKNEGHK